MKEEIKEKYYSMTTGYVPEEKEQKEVDNVIDYLLDNRICKETIIEILLELEEIHSSNISYDRFDTLLKQNKFYYHNQLHITSKPPSFNPITMEETSHPFFLEMKIVFTLNDLMNYYYDKCLIPFGIRDESKDKGSLKHLISKYSKMNVESIDIVLSLIDKASEDKDTQLYNVFDLERYIKDVHEYYECMIPMAKFNKTNRIVWR